MAKSLKASKQHARDIENEDNNEDYDISDKKKKGKVKSKARNEDAEDDEQEPETLVRKFRLRNETKGAFRYEELKQGSKDKVAEMSDPDCLIGTLYVRKSGIGLEKAPKTITVTIET